MVCILVTYGLLQADRIRQESAWYSVANAVGAALVLYSLYYDFNLPAFMIESFWLLISLYGLGRSLRRRGAGTENNEASELPTSTSS